jgi:hypothetical protein
MILKTTLSLTLIATLIILSAGCIDNTEPETRYVYIETEPEIISTPIYVAPKEPIYTKIWCMTTISINAYDIDDYYIDSFSETAEITIPYTEYDWTDDSTSIEDIMDSLGVQYNYIVTLSEETSYPTDNKYIMSGKYDVYFDGGSAIITITATATRY